MEVQEAEGVFEAAEGPEAAEAAETLVVNLNTAPGNPSPVPSRPQSLWRWSKPQKQILESVRRSCQLRGECLRVCALPLVRFHILSCSGLVTNHSTRLSLISALDREFQDGHTGASPRASYC